MSQADPQESRERLGHCRRAPPEQRQATISFPSPHWLARSPFSPCGDDGLGNRHRPPFPCASDDWANAASLRHLFAGGDDHPPGMPAPFSPLPSRSRPPQTLSYLNPDLTMIPTSFEFLPKKKKKSSGAHILGSLLCASVPLLISTRAAGCCRLYFGCNQCMLRFHVVLASLWDHSLVSTMCL
jgi:hypothetical protein